MGDRRTLVAKWNVTHLCKRTGRKKLPSLTSFCKRCLKGEYSGLCLHIPPHPSSLPDALFLTSLALSRQPPPPPPPPFCSVAAVFIFLSEGRFNLPAHVSLYWHSPAQHLQRCWKPTSHSIFLFTPFVLLLIGVRYTNSFVFSRQKPKADWLFSSLI